MRGLCALVLVLGLAACGESASGGHNVSGGQSVPSDRGGPPAAAAESSASESSATASSAAARSAAARSAAGNSATASSASPAQATRLGALGSEGMPAGFKLADTPRKFEFPQDHGPHPAFRHEWWYVTGHLDADTGERFGFELTFFRFALAPPSAEANAAHAGAAQSTLPKESTSAEAASAAAAVPGGAAAATAGTAAPATSASEPARGIPSAWRTRQIYMAHFAVTDLDRRTFHSWERYARDALGLAGAQAEPFRMWLGEWFLGTPPGDTGPEGSSDWQLRAADDGYALDLQLRPVTPPVLNGDAGLSRKSGAPGAASYYYSIPRLAAQGHLIRDGKPLEVSGLAWLDREWGSGALGRDQQGWDWFALQFNDGSTLMFYALRKRDGERDPHSAGTWLAPDGSVHPLASGDVQIEVKDTWQSPRGGRYPARWQMRVPSLNLDVDIQPRLADQELDTRPRYWEGAATISGTRNGNAVAGRAYVELVGYANEGQ